MKETRYIPFEFEDEIYRADLYVYPSGNVIVNIRGSFNDSAFWPNGTPKFFKGRIACFQLVNGLPSDTTKPEPLDLPWKPYFDAIKDELGQVMEWF